MKVIERFYVKGRGWVVVLEPSPPRRPKVGSLLRCDSGTTYTIRGVEAHAIPEPKPPFGLLTGAVAPYMGETVELVETIDRHDAWREGYEAGRADALRVMETGEAFRRTPNPYPEGT